MVRFCSSLCGTGEIILNLTCVFETKTWAFKMCGELTRRWVVDRAKSYCSITKKNNNKSKRYELYRLVLVIVGKARPPHRYNEG